MRVRKIDPVERHAAFYDGTRIGERGEDGKVIDRTAPEWFPALAREWDGKSLTMDVTVGDLIAKPDGTLIYVAPGEFVEIAPGSWIVTDGVRISSMTDPTFRSLYECCLAKAAVHE